MKEKEPMLTKVILRRNKVRGCISLTIRLRRTFNCNVTTGFKIGKQGRKNGRQINATE